MRRVAALVLALLILATPTADAATRNGYGKSAAVVARWGGCENARHPDGGGLVKSSLVCDLQGRRVNVITFRDKRQQATWRRLCRENLPSQWVMFGRGFVVTAYDGNFKSARVAADVYGGTALPCDAA